jgi:tetraacyldisaccharide 4'-kinase
MSGPLPGYLAPLAVPASWIYERVIAARNARFDRGQGVQRIDRPVISVGNITTGGTGKTPMVMWIAERLIDAGYKPAIAMRGYKSVNGKSDEQMEYADRLPGVPVIANPERAAALREYLPQHPEIDCVILDDGFQHRQLHRDLDLVLIDATANTFNDRLLPAGHLREPLENLRRADAIIITHADAPSDSELSRFNAQILTHHGRPTLAVSRHVWSRLDVHQNQSVQSLCDVDWLREKRVLTLVGIGNKRAIQRECRRLNVKVVADLEAEDHDWYDNDTTLQLQNRLTILKMHGKIQTDMGCDAIFATAKDWVKLRDLIDWSAWPVPIVVPRLELEVFDGADRLVDLVLSKVNAESAGKPAG